MHWTNTAEHYGLAQIGLHWLSAAMIAVLIPLGLWMIGLDYYDPWYKRGPDIHRALGVLFGVLLGIRLLVRRLQPRPRPLAANDRQAAVARWLHRLLYVLPALLVVSGYLVSTADGRAVDVFGWFNVPASLHGIEHQADIAGDVHFALAMTLLAGIVLHVAAALHHHFFLGDATLRRMLRPGQRAPD
ncbi:MAG: cytochrome b [Gammaproteobacteria bacterium]|nr:cytochrome b [Gammaproteobacteria bacterium]